MGDDSDVASIRGSRPWRAAIWGLRLLCLAVTLFVVVGIVAAAGGSKAADSVAVPAFTALLFGLVLTLISAAVLIPKTSRYSGVAGGEPSVRRMVGLVRAVISDLAGKRS